MVITWQSPTGGLYEAEEDFVIDGRTVTIKYVRWLDWKKNPPEWRGRPGDKKSND